LPNVNRHLPLDLTITTTTTKATITSFILIGPIWIRLGIIYHQKVNQSCSVWFSETILKSSTNEVTSSIASFINWTTLTHLSDSNDLLSSPYVWLEAYWIICVPISQYYRST
jgi:hypothetical protein